MIAPDAGNFVEQGLGGVGIHRHDRQREVGQYEGAGQGPERNGDQEKLEDGRRCGDTHPNGIPAPGADQGQGALQGGGRESQDEGKMSEFRGHDRLPPAFPLTGFLDRLRDLRRHVCFIVLGQDLGGDEHAFAQVTLGDDALTLAE